MNSRAQKKTPRLRNLKTALSAHIRSKPTVEEQRYLDLYVLQRDRLRWSRLRDQAEQMIRGIDNALAEMSPSPGGDADEQGDPPGPPKTIRFGKRVQQKPSASRRKSRAAT